MIIRAYNITRVLDTERGGEDSYHTVKLIGKCDEILSVQAVTRNPNDAIASTLIMMWVKHNEELGGGSIRLKCIPIALWVDIDKVFPNGYEYLGTILIPEINNNFMLSHHIFLVYDKKEAVTNTIDETVNF